MTNKNNIRTIVLQNILFDNNKTRNEFLEFFSKNINVQNLIFDNVKVETEKFLTILQTFNNLQWLEISRCELTQDDDNNFRNVLLYLKNLKYLTLTNNPIWEGFHEHLFSKNTNKTHNINGTPYIIYMFWKKIIIGG